MKSSILNTKQPAQRGFTLVEIAIVLVIIGLLIGGVLRGQELINSARINSIASQQSSIQTAYYGFIDRYKFQPGDLNDAQALSVNTNTVVAKTLPANGNVELSDSPAFFNNLAQAGFLACTACTSGVTAGSGTTGATYTTQPTTLTASNTMVNVYGQALAFFSDTGINGGSTGGSIAFLATSAEASKPILTTGGGLSSNMLAELDRKSDDGTPSGGQFRYTDVLGSGGLSTAASGSAYSTTSFAKCVGGSGTTAAPYTWMANPPGICQGGSMF